MNDIKKNTFDENIEKKIQESPDPSDVGAIHESPATEEQILSEEEQLAEEQAQIMEALVTLMKEQEEWDQKYLRMQADFDNFRKRTRQEKEELIKSANTQLVLALLPVIDNLERALDKCDDDSYKTGVDLVYRQLLQVLNNAGLEVIEALGTDFDPTFHDAVGQVDTAEEADKGKVMIEIQKGYTFNGKLLRATMVQVGK
jgi:molecular chaperone GrpE